MIAIAHFGMAGPEELSEEGWSSPDALVVRDEEEEEVREAEATDSEESREESEEAAAAAEEAERDERDETEDKDEAVRIAKDDDNEVGAAVST